MIVPLEVKLDMLSFSDTPTYRVQAVAYDTDREVVMTWDLHTLVDHSHEPPRAGTITHSPLEARRKYLTKLRDQLNEVLGDA